MGLRIRVRNLGGFPVEAFYSEFTNEPSMTIQRGLSHARNRARELEGHGYYQRPPRWGRKCCFAASDEEQVDYGTVRALRRVLEEMEPSWVESVHDACRMFNEPRLIAGWCELPVQVVLTALVILEARGDATVPDA